MYKSKTGRRTSISIRIHIGHNRTYRACISIRTSLSESGSRGRRISKRIRRSRRMRRRRSISTCRSTRRRISRGIRSKNRSRRSKKTKRKPMRTSTSTK